MKFQCLNPACKRTFVYAAKKTQYYVLVGYPDRDPPIQEEFASPENANFVRETHICPYCQSLDFTEYVEPAPQTESVYVHDLTTGPQTAIDGLLAQGYVIVGRYSKQYVLEKQKQPEESQLGDKNK